MKNRAFLAWIVCLLMLAQKQGYAQSQQFFRLIGSNAAVITSFEMPGALVWSNAVPGEIATIEVVDPSLGNPVWRQFAFVPVTSAVMNVLFSDVHPTGGMDYRLDFAASMSFLRSSSGKRQPFTHTGLHVPSQGSI